VCLSCQLTCDNCHSLPKIVISWGVFCFRVVNQVCFHHNFQSQKALIFFYSDCALLRLRDYVYCSWNLLIFLIWFWGTLKHLIFYSSYIHRLYILMPVLEIHLAIRIDRLLTCEFKMKWLHIFAVLREPVYCKARQPHLFYPG
jgi:hypothetical protein